MGAEKLSAGNVMPGDEHT